MILGALNRSWHGWHLGYLDQELGCRDGRTSRRRGLASGAEPLRSPGKAVSQPRLVGMASLANSVLTHECN